MTKPLLLFGALLLLLYTGAEAKTLLQEIEETSSLSEAASIIRGDVLLTALLKTRAYTAFMPTNDAFQQYKGRKDTKLLEYHLANLAYEIEQLPDMLSTYLAGNPPVYITKIPSGNPSQTGWKEHTYYINNAKVIEANKKASAEDGSAQMLHIVDRVITPTSPLGPAPSPEYQNPDAENLLEKPHLYGLSDNISISEFHKRLTALNVDVFGMPGKNTFFIPVDQAVIHAEKSKQDVIDKQVLHGHVIPDQVLFTRTVELSNEKYRSYAFTDNLKVFLEMENVTGDDGLVYYVKSHTVASDMTHNRGTVLARIMKANIAVKNGVVHLIDRPLMVVASNIISYLREQGGQLSMFYDLIREHYSDLVNELVTKKDVTLFAPYNEAFKIVKQDSLKKIIADNDQLIRLLRLHIIGRRLTTDEIVDKHIGQEETLSNHRKLYFAVNNGGSYIPTVSLEGAGVNATIITPNIGAHNGVIHIIDRILGIPSQTVYEKLSSDPMLSSTFALSEQQGWNKRLNSRDEHFTFFAPSNEAWEYIQRNWPSSHKKLFMGIFSYQVQRILERHLIVGEDLSLEKLSALTTNTTTTTSEFTLNKHRLDMSRGKIYFEAKIYRSFGDVNENGTIDSGNETNGEYNLEWNGLRAQVIRPDVKCVNGVVHVINKVLMFPRDVTVNGGSAIPSVTGFVTLISTFVTVAFARALHH